jgi:hypothetical protein
MLRKIEKFLKLTGSQKWDFLKIWALLGWVRAAILVVPLRRLVARLDHYRDYPAVPPLAVGQLKQAEHYGELVAIVARYTPWQSQCLVQVLVLQRLLARRNIAGQFYLGVQKKRGGSEEPEGLLAHAWLQCGEAIVCGEPGHEGYSVVSTFRWGGADV